MSRIGLLFLTCFEKPQVFYYWILATIYFSPSTGGGTGLAGRFSTLLIWESVTLNLHFNFTGEISVMLSHFYLIPVVIILIWTCFYILKKMAIKIPVYNLLCWFLLKKFVCQRDNSLSMHTTVVQYMKSDISRGRWWPNDGQKFCKIFEGWGTFVSAVEV